MDITNERTTAAKKDYQALAMEVAPAATTRVPLPLPAAGKRLLLALAPRGGFASISVASSFGGGGGGGGGRFSAGGGGGGGDDSGAGAAAAAATAAAALGEAEPAGADSDPDAIVLHVEGMSCDGCAAKVKRILESQPEVTAAMVHFEKAIALVWTAPEAKATEDWQKQLDEGEATKADSSPQQ
ncbi:copper-transporting ATPase PAA1, chloroplastic-like isoform X2 [Phragmites australis]|uniref:copper-transporting ATPase PAA1, chloroplastic-like isoform X2 n=1 Tax=Phragmites australis TaxID=29695 RepID=UPI002D79E775|nr:copper-transporting ATPase PAA1, chloroplastic-like isoform X2 [Phragmites australis]